MVNNKTEHSCKTPAKQGPEEIIAEPNKIGAATPFDFEAKGSLKNNNSQLIGHLS